MCSKFDHGLKDLKTVSERRFSAFGGGAVFSHTKRIRHPGSFKGVKYKRKHERERFYSKTACAVLLLVEADRTLTIVYQNSTAPLFMSLSYPENVSKV